MNDVISANDIGQDEQSVVANITCARRCTVNGFAGPTSECSRGLGLRSNAVTSHVTPRVAEPRRHCRQHDFGSASIQRINDVEYAHDPALGMPLQRVSYQLVQDTSSAMLDLERFGVSVRHLVEGKWAFPPPEPSMTGLQVVPRNVTRYVAGCQDWLRPFRSSPPLSGWRLFFHESPGLFRYLLSRLRPFIGACRRCGGNAFYSERSLSSAAVDGWPGGAHGGLQPVSLGGLLLSTAGLWMHSTIGR